LLAGIAGMSLATVIRLEFAYPGVGILAGDSLQYLSIVTAHGVIMVFYMIMPVIFGSFGNFLLPTQLGVHDVAFPRLNSAAFWFLPGGLIMLFQLVCTDRRYQKMNCFNIRELQSILKRRFFYDLINLHDYRGLLHNSLIDLRYKLHNNHSITHNTYNFYIFGLYLAPYTKSVILTDVSTIYGNNKNTISGAETVKLPILFYEILMLGCFDRFTYVRNFFSNFNLVTVLHIIKDTTNDFKMGLKEVIGYLLGGSEFM